MSFIGIVANRKYFENIKKKIVEEIKDDTINFIQINLRSIENVKNIKFETIIVEDNLRKFKDSQNIIEKLFESAQYLMINTDKNPEYENMEKNKDVITYGLNRKATVTVSSISETDILVYWQKSLLNKEAKKVEIEEIRIKKERNQLFNTYEILVIYTLLKIYN